MKHLGSFWLMGIFASGLIISVVFFFENAHEEVAWLESELARDETLAPATAAAAANAKRILTEDDREKVWFQIAQAKAGLDAVDYDHAQGEKCRSRNLVWMAVASGCGGLLAGTVTIALLRRKSKIESR